MYVCPTTSCLHSTYITLTFSKCTSLHTVLGQHPNGALLVITQQVRLSYVTNFMLAHVTWSQDTHLSSSCCRSPHVGRVLPIQMVCLTGRAAHCPAAQNHQMQTHPAVVWGHSLQDSCTLHYLQQRKNKCIIMVNLTDVPVIDRTC